MLDSDVVFDVIEYDQAGTEVRRMTESVPLERPPDLFAELAAAGASRTGAKAVPDNTDSLGLVFRMKVLSDTPPNRRLIPVWEVDKPWRRGWGIGTWDGEFARVWGVWIPWKRPRLPKVEIFIDHERLNVSPAELLGPQQ